MAKLPNYNGSIDLISGLRPKNNGTFPLMEAHDVQVTETQRLDDMFAKPESWLPIYNGENEGGAEGGSGGSVSAGVPQYNLSTVLKLGEEVFLDTVDTTALSSIMSDMNNLLKFQNVGVVVYQEEAEGHQPFIGLDIKTDFVVNRKIVFSYQGLFYNLDIVADLANGIITGKLISQFKAPVKITRTKVTLAELEAMLTTENVGTRVDFIPKSTFRDVLPSNEALLYMTGVFPTTGIIIQIAEDVFYIAGNGTAYTPALTSQFWDVSISVDSKGRGIVTGATMNNGVLEANYQWNFADYVTDAYFDFYIYK